MNNVSNVKILVSGGFLQPVELPLILLGAVFLLLAAVAAILTARSLGGGRR